MKKDIKMHNDDELVAQLLIFSDKYVVYQYQKAVPIDFIADITIQFKRSVTPCL